MRKKAFRLTFPLAWKTHTSGRKGSMGPTPSTIPGRQSTSTKSSKIRTTLARHSKPAPGQAYLCPSPCPSLCPAPCMARTYTAPSAAHICLCPSADYRSCPCLWPWLRPSLQCPGQWCAPAARPQHQKSFRLHPFPPRASAPFATGVRLAPMGAGDQICPCPSPCGIGSAAGGVARDR